MEQPSLFDDNGNPRDAARARRDDGMARAAAHADAIKALWTEAAMHVFELYLAEHAEPFLAEQFIAWSRGYIDQPPDGRAWGSVLAAARRRGLIDRVGTANAVTSNLSPKPLWQGV
jgi:hypothetical protein